LREYYLENELRVEMGLKPTVFRSISTGVTTPAHEIIHYMSSIHNNDAYTSSVIQSFNQSFKEMPNVFSLTQDRGILFGVIDSKFRDKINSKGFDIRGKDLNDPFIFWEIIKKHGVEIADATDVPLNKLYDASFNYLSKYIPFRLLEEGVASYLSINNASIDRTPKELSGLDKSLKSLVNLGSKLRKLEYFERAIDFYTGNKQLADYYIPELQLYPLSYLYVAYQVDNQKPNNAKWYFDLLRQNYQKRNLSMPSFPRHVERKTREEAYPHLAQQQRIQALIEQTNQNIQNYTRRLDEIDRLLSEYRNQLNQLQEHSSSSPGFDYNYSDLGQISSYEPRRTRPTTELDRLLNNHRVRSSVRRYINNNEVLSTLSVVALGAVAGYTISRVLRGLFDR